MSPKEPVTSPAIAGQEEEGKSFLSGFSLGGVGDWVKDHPGMTAGLAVLGFGAMKGEFSIKNALLAMVAGWALGPMLMKMVGVGGDEHAAAPVTNTSTKQVADHSIPSADAKGVVDNNPELKNEKTVVGSPSEADKAPSAPPAVEAKEQNTEVEKQH